MREARHGTWLKSFFTPGVTEFAEPAWTKDVSNFLTEGWMFSEHLLCGALISADVITHCGTRLTGWVSWKGTPCIGSCLVDHLQVSNSEQTLLPGGLTATAAVDRVIGLLASLILDYRTLLWTGECWNWKSYSAVRDPLASDGFLLLIGKQRLGGNVTTTRRASG